MNITARWCNPQRPANVVTSGPLIARFAAYEVLRSRNGREAEVVSIQRENAPTAYVDRDLELGDEVTYLVQAFDRDEQVVGASVRRIVLIG